MNAPLHDSPTDYDLPVRLRALEERLARVEQLLNLAMPEAATEAAEPEGRVTELAKASERGSGASESVEDIERELGQNWFARVGILVLALGFVFLLTLPYAGLPPGVPTLAGYVLAVALVWLGRWLSRSQPRVSRYLLGGALLLFYFATLRLSFFGATPAVQSRAILMPALVGVVALNLVVAHRRRSPYLVAIQLMLACVTALVSGDAWLVCALLTVVCLVTVLLSRHHGWVYVPPVLIACVVLTHATWALGNPLLGNPVRVVSGPEMSLLFLLIYAAIFVGGEVYGRGNASGEQPVHVVQALLVSAGIYLCLLFLTVTAFKVHLVEWNVVASVFFLGFAVMLWVRRRSRWSTFLYAMTGYMALSAAILEGAPVPSGWVWLCWQSLLVVSTAVWFRSRFIVVSNFAIFLLLVVAYLLSPGSGGPVSISFGVVALATARILNWQKDRLELRTELMRNAYLCTALLVIPWALYNTVPRGLVSISWLGVAALYYVASRVLNNRKYRWMALLTMGLTVIWVFTVDLVALSPALRVVSFLALGLVLMAVSMVYGRRREPAPSQAKQMQQT